MAIRASIPLASRQLDWTLSTTEVFEYFAKDEWAILLDSASASHQDAKFDIICAAPIATLVTKGERSEITLMQSDLTLPAKTNVTDDPFELVNSLLNHWYPNAIESGFPFAGGAMGSFSYDLGRRIETLPTTAKQDIQLPEMNIGFYDWALIFNYQTQCWHLLHYLGEKALEIELNKIQHKLTKKPNSAAFMLTSPWATQINKAQYTRKFEAVQAYLHSGDCYQINLTQRFEASYQGDEWAAYCQLRKANKAPFSAFMRLPQNAILSISPERFIQLRGDDIQTKPIKGTMPRHADPLLDTKAASTLANSPKDRAENVMIVDLLRNDIGKVAAAGSVRVPHLFEIESFPAVHHLVSTVTAKLASQFTASDLLRAAFPGGSITGAPKIRAMEIIEELEPSRRSLYCGCMGYLSQDGQMDTSITIRTLIAERGKLYCWAGGGIVADSEVNAEYQETFDKISRILPLLGAE
ncbi:aminodeoxychorismate synthase component I [Shewanella sp. JNE10-2]|uniref:aminodeoxychorismate synthase component I n=1 Tax=unclassified Shewanella TaxID=196818 RepID=UPI0020040F23|nr:MULTISPECIES: aminodeoxychorismate synthase component I [unclassified Shewanella]MCK7628697.1 aminodeoxychorismate synthase component I [Shewanella sp. JNE9-1]MCK7633042.1 aminodeoxychorismate synthase component I [Shewanella sp. JNE17]MCK7643947.1 aminodeoxychorismate synthase component I [Shewanella sp. JNE3-1]MCK7648358.1 aminodeoxychorismate synthase component I [Shewanella sp. JNE8]MCK7652001.1 aminodeoxychorismate synthase component I [Shewanella sp. JNE4-1]